MQTDPPGTTVVPDEEPIAAPTPAGTFGTATTNVAARGHGAITDADMARAAELFDRLARAYESKVVGQSRLRTTLVVTLLAEGHILLESVPGLAKTTAAATLACAVNASFVRIQCT